MRSVRSELLSAAVVLSAPAAIVAAFPYAALGFRAAQPPARPAMAAMVRLTPEAERAAERAARATWQLRGESLPGRPELLAPELPESPLRSVLSVRERSRPPAPPDLDCGLRPFAPSRKAPPPEAVGSAPAPEPAAFPREELLKLN